MIICSCKQVSSVDELQTLLSAFRIGRASMAIASTLNNAAPKYAEIQRKVVYKSDPAHQGQPTLYLRNLRDKGDYRICDVELRVKAMRIRIHSAVIAAHSAKIANMTEEAKDVILRIIYHNRAAITANEIMALSPWAIKALVSARVSKQVKIALINISVNWLRHPRNLPYATSVLPLITIDQMHEKEMTAFQQTLKTALRNPSTRQSVTVSLDNSGRPVIRMDRHSFQKNAGKTVEDLDSKKPSTSIFRQLIPKKLNEIKLISDDNSGGSEEDEDLPSYKETKK
ncbi:hypothetical protein OSTOST_04454, partial [Ostertagia ostertagi]